ncbi:hypothetical protein A0H81_02387 [Grifola frondosa]|uniref:Uncharacterized protein n=1 Tax=Grifola frondosa TaxID=5627 RepID=A0A1C7MLN6_GRIFR|nr:hypothetical protein A0H81_02387 [Grifola frondosa]
MSDLNNTADEGPCTRIRNGDHIFGAFHDQINWYWPDLYERYSTHDLEMKSCAYYSSTYQFVSVYQCSDYGRADSPIYVNSSPCAWICSRVPIRTALLPWQSLEVRVDVMPPSTSVAGPVMDISYCRNADPAVAEPKP